MSATTGSRPAKKRAAPKPRARSGGGSGQHPLTIIGGVLALLFLLVCTIGMMTGAKPSDVWSWATSVGHATVTKVSAARCALHTCPKDDAGAALEQLRVAPEGSKAGYSRPQFGTPWADVDHNGCDTRDDILRRDMQSVTLRPGSQCVVTGGTLVDPYTGVTVTSPHDVQPDHVVSLGEAWRSGAAAWTPAQRLAYANDPDVLQGTSGSVNEAKSDWDVAHAWKLCVQRNAKHRCVRNIDARPVGDRACSYAEKVIAIKGKYGLTVDPAEVVGLRQDLAACAS